MCTKSYGLELFCEKPEETRDAQKDVWQHPGLEPMLYLVCDIIEL